MLVIDLSTRSGSYTTGATPIFCTNLSQPFPLPLDQLYMLRKGFHPKMKYVLAFCFIYGSSFPVLKLLSPSTTILFFARRYSPSCNTFVVLQEAAAIRHRKADMNFLLSIYLHKNILILSYLKILAKKFIIYHVFN